MSVYVDDLTVSLKNRNWPYSHSCHLVADTVEELHYFAGRMRLKPAWFQDKPELPHYDLTKGMRKYAVSLGAIEINWKGISDLMQMYRSRRTGP
jgi:hypothetical protein